MSPKETLAIGLFVVGTIIALSATLMTFMYFSNVMIALSVAILMGSWVWFLVPAAMFVLAAVAFFAAWACSASASLAEGG